MKPNEALRSIPVDVIKQANATVHSYVERTSHAQQKKGDFVGMRETTRWYGGEILPVTQAIAVVHNKLIDEMREAHRAQDFNKVWDTMVFYGGGNLTEVEEARLNAIFEEELGIK